MWIDKVSEIAKSTLTGWKVEKGALGVTATYLEAPKPYHIYVCIVQIMNSVYVVKFCCDSIGSLSADCIKVAHTDGELEVILDDLRIGVLYHLFDGLEEKLNEAMREYMVEFEKVF